MQIYATIDKHPNSGKTARQLSIYHDKLLEYSDEKKKLRPYEKPETMLSIVANLAIKNPKYYNWSMAILSILVDYCPMSKQRIIVNKLVKKFNQVPNTGLLDIWLQRVSFKNYPDRQFSERITELVTQGRYPGNSVIWSCSWLEKDMEKIIVRTPIIDRSELKKISTVIRSNGTALFRAPLMS